MLLVYQLIIPTPYKVGPVNIYLIKNHPVTLVDTGVDTPEGYKRVKDLLHLLGVELKDIKRVVLTHSHVDHSGLAAKIARDAGAVVLANQWEIRKLTGEERYFKERMSFVMETGIEGDMLSSMLGEKDKLPPLSINAADLQVVKDGDILSFDGGELVIMHLPGHSPGHLCLYDPRQRYFFSGDFILPHITPNPLMEPDPLHPDRRLPTLKQYLHGLDRVEELDVSLVFPGHGGVCSDCKSIIATAREHHGRQINLVLRKLQGKDLNTYQLCREIYPTLKGWELFLGLSEIQAHLDFMVEMKQVGNYKRGGVVFYTVS